MRPDCEVLSDVVRERTAPPETDPPLAPPE